MFIGRDFPVFEDGQSRVLGFDLTAVLASGETIVSATATLIVWRGVDADLALNPNARFIGTVLISGNVITQGVILNDPLGLLVGNIYALRVTATTSAGQKISPWGRFEVVHGYGSAALALIFLTSDSGVILTDDSGNPLTSDGGSGDPSIAAQIIVLPAAPLKLTIPGLSGFLGQDYPLADTGENWFYGTDFSPALSPNETIIAASPSLMLIYGSDPVLAENAQVYFGGGIPLVDDHGNPITDDHGNPLVSDSMPPVINGSVVQQLVMWPLPIPDIGGNVYAFGLNIATSFNQAISLWSRIGIGVGFESQAVLQVAA